MTELSKELLSALEGLLTSGAVHDPENDPKIGLAFL